jgi:hypothetical protein
VRGDGGGAVAAEPPRREVQREAEGRDDDEGTRTARMKVTIEIASSRKLSSGLATPPVTVVDTVRTAALAACGTRADGAPTAAPRTSEVKGSVTLPSTEAASRAPAAGRSGVPIASRAWSTAGILSPTSSIAVATPNRTSAFVDARNWNDGPTSRTPRRANPPARRSGSHARSPADAARAMARASASRNSVSVDTSMVFPA